MTSIGKFARILSGSAAIIALASPAIAQAPAADAPEGEIVVTASRVARSGFTAPTPTTVLGEEAIQARGATNVAEVINEIPAFRPSSSPASGARGGGTSGASFLDLRGLNGQASGAVARTLVLLDGRRIVPANGGGLVDINMIPSSLIGRTEVVTGGASAAWGSDAITGVVNLIIKDNIEGLEGGISYGQSDQGDNQEYSVNLAGGAEFAEGRGRILAGFEYTDNQGVPDGFVSRDWGRKGVLELAYGATGPTATRPAGVPRRLIAEDTRVSDQAAAGGVTFSANATLDNLIFTGSTVPGQQLSRFTPCSLVVGNQMTNCGATASNAGVYLNGGSNLINPIQRGSFFTRLNYDLTPDVAAFLELSHAESEYTGFSAQRRDFGSATGGIAVARTNPFIPSDLAARMLTAGVTTINVGRFAYDDALGYNNYDNITNQSVQRIATGLRGKIFGDWNWDAYYQYGENNFVQKNQSTIVANFLSAVNVQGTAANPTCGPITATQTAAFGSPAAGCVPFSIFGPNGTGGAAATPASQQAAVNYFLGVGVNDFTTRQNVAAINLNGDLFELPAGPVSLATGLEYRREEAFSSVDQDSAARRFDLNNFQAIDGDYDTKEAYAETVVPILRDQPLANLLEFNAAFRYTYYSSVEDVTTWKAGITYEPIADVRLRATQSRDTRAPSINELGLTVAGRATIAGGTQVNSITVGNPSLTQEDADTTTYGVVYSPSWFSGFRASVDYYKIEIDNVIGTIAVGDIYDRCVDGTVPANCNLIAPFGARGTAVVSVTAQQLNLTARETSGVDLELSYAVPEDFLVPGQFQLRLLGSYVEELVTVDPQIGAIDRAEQTVPRYAGNFSVNYNLGRLSTNATVRYVGETVVDTTYQDPTYTGYSAASAVSINDNTRPDITYLNLSASYDLIQRDNGKQLQIYGVVNNVTDRDPPTGGATNTIGASLYDLVGRAYKVGLRFKY